MGPVGAVLLLLSAATCLCTGRSPDRSLRVFSGYILLNTVASLGVHALVREASLRSTALMLLDAVGLYAMGLAAVCRLDRPLWLYGLTAATALQCAAHLFWVGRLLPDHLHVLALNLLFLVQLAALMSGRKAAAEDDLSADPSEAAPLPA